MLAFIIKLCLIVAGLTLRGFVLVMLWQWFVVAFTGAPGLSIPIAIGFMIIAAYLTHPVFTIETVRTVYKNKTPESQENTSLANLLIYLYVTPICVLLVGWIVTLFM